MWYSAIHLMLSDTIKLITNIPLYYGHSTVYGDIVFSFVEDAR